MASTRDNVPLIPETLNGPGNGVIEAFLLRVLNYLCENDHGSMILLTPNTQWAAEALGKFVTSDTHNWSIKFDISKKSKTFCVLHYGINCIGFFNDILYIMDNNKISKIFPYTDKGADDFAKYIIDAKVESDAYVAKDTSQLGVSSSRKNLTVNPHGYGQCVDVPQNTHKSDIYPQVDNLTTSDEIQKIIDLYQAKVLKLQKEHIIIFAKEVLAKEVLAKEEEEDKILAAFIAERRRKRECDRVAIDKTDEDRNVAVRSAKDKSIPKKEDHYKSSNEFDTKRPKSTRYQLY